MPHTKPDDYRAAVDRYQSQIPHDTARRRQTHARLAAIGVPITLVPKKTSKKTKG